ncbi:MAG: hypothetical protein GY786_02145, partial [Proteobacteria bacterium]|nr:hypothetical protein [Pseudomonadota bacterium]
MINEGYLILDQVSLIAEKMGEFNIGSRQISPQLRKLNKIKTITGTLQIEGSTLTEEQVSAVLEGKRVMGSVRELAEVKGVIMAYEHLSQLDPLNLPDLLKAHEWLMENILNNAGRFRTKPIFQSLPLESVIKDHQEEYYRALRQSDESSEINASANALENTLV